ncbi:uncharacterized protein [Drosophila bipectinata]|uniref:uncharacterized protein n=1 Tax=Drosophila bipectinata TaxID=42026 RepID=UPI0038B32798
MDAVGQFRCPRHYFGRGAVRTIELHVFVDASQSAFAAVVFWRITYEDGNMLVSFVCAKTTCAPMRTTSIPRLELQAAVLGSRVMNTVKEEHSVDISKTVLWTDSKTVLKWIGSTHRRYKQFVGNRVAEILESFGFPSGDGGLQLTQRMIRHASNGWPAPEEGTEHVPDASDEEEMLCEFALVASNGFVIPFQRFSSFSRLAQLESFPDEMRSADRVKDVKEIQGLAPLILSHRHSLTEMVVRHYHAQMKHQNVDATIAQIRTRFWITKMRRVLKELVTVARHKEKPWVALFTCLMNFVCRRGTLSVRKLRSDNGKNFVGADKEARRFGDVFETERIQSELSSRSIEWGFNCPSNPSEGGVWQCVKRVLRHTHFPVDADQEAPLTRLRRPAQGSS